jgi:hypothetical protein
MKKESKMAKSPIPIKFKAGSFGGIADGQVARVSDAQPFSFTAKAGQLLTFICGGGGPNGPPPGDPLTVLLNDPKGNAVPPGNPFQSGATVTLPVTGAYSIVVGLDNMEESWNGTFTICLLVAEPQVPV